MGEGVGDVCRGSMGRGKEKRKGAEEEGGGQRGVGDNVGLERGGGRWKGEGVRLDAEPINSIISCVKKARRRRWGEKTYAYIDHLAEVVLLHRSVLLHLRQHHRDRMLGYRCPSRS